MGEEHVGSPGLPGLCLPWKGGQELPAPGKQVWVSRSAEGAAEGGGTAGSWAWVTTVRDWLVLPWQVRSRAADIPSEITKTYISHACQGLCNLHSL